MINIYRLFSTTVLFIGLVGFCGGAQAAPKYQSQGEIFQLSGTTINISDQRFRLSPTVKVIFPGNQKAKLTDLKKGNNVGVTFIIYNRKQYVDTIYYLPAGLPTNE